MQKQIKRDILNTAVIFQIIITYVRKLVRQRRERRQIKYKLWKLQEPLNGIF